MKFDPERPYQDLPSLPPATQLETVPVLKALPQAHAALARLDASCALLPDPAILINLVPLLEAQASSEIENIVTTRDELFKAANLAEVPMSAATKEALNYRSALREGFESLSTRPLSFNTARMVCSVLRGHEEDVRNCEVYIASQNRADRIYTPPTGKQTLLQKLSNWENYLHQAESVDPLIMMSVAHYQFEAIHPFVDGNGRTGRILNLLALCHFGLLHEPVLYLSGHLVRTKNTYYRLLREVTTHGAWEPWLLYMIDSVRSTANWTSQLIADIYKLRHTVEIAIRQADKNISASDVAQVLFMQPYLRLVNVMDKTGVSRPTATRWMRQLAKVGIVDELKVGRHVLFINTALLKLLFDADIKHDAPEGP